MFSLFNNKYKYKSKSKEREPLLDTEPNPSPNKQCVSSIPKDVGIKWSKFKTPTKGLKRY
jgi:hypothetical protein